MLRYGLVLLAGLVVVGAIAWGVGYAKYRARMAEALAVWDAIGATETGLVFDPAALDGQPEIARRYLTHAIAPGTPLQPTVTLTMDGTFRLGDEANPRSLAMTARQRLAAPGAFVWIPRMSGSGMVIVGSDGFDGTHGWTRFWMFRALPLVQLAATEGLDRSALARPALEAIWAPAALHPALCAKWAQTGPDSADVTFTQAPTPMTISLTLSSDGALKSVVTQRWSDANPEKIFQWQPFGGSATAEATFGGYTIPSEMEAGNHYGTPAYFPFFEVRITGADYSAD